MFGSILLVTEGRPLYRQEHGSGDLIAGADFLSMLSGMRSIDEDATTTAEEIEPVRETTANILSSTKNNEARTFTENPSDDLINQVNVDFSKESSDSLSANDGLIISVRVSSSVEKKVLNKIEPIVTTTVAAEAVLAEDHPSLIAEANKSEFSVEESEPITRNNRNYEPLPSPQPYEGSSINKPYHETIIYHNNREANRARSVSYSTVIQSIPNVQKPWVNQNLTEDSKPSSAAETKDYYVTSKYNPSDYNESLEKRYETSSRNYYEGTERNWGRNNYPQKQYIAPKPYNPVVYPQPEQNYEVDEAVSVETNGRAHGIQSADNKSKKDDNQKVGYVVEGRNYRKYRVEERTSDGFIVGEYGVVSHDDGSLRGVRYTADGTINPRLIYDALMKFLAL